MTTQDLRYRLLQQEDADFDWKDDSPKDPPHHDEEVLDVLQEPIPNTWEAMLWEISPGLRRL